MSTAVAIVFLAMGLGAVVRTRVKDGDFVTPGAVILAAWSLSFGLYLLRMLPYGPMPSSAAGVLALGVACLVGGVTLGRRLARNARPHRRSASSPDAWLTAYGIAGMAGVGWYLAEVQRYIGLRAIFEKGFEVREALGHYDIPSRFLFLEFFCVVAPLVAIAMFVTGHRLRPRHWALVAGCVAGTWVTTDRTQFFTLVLTGLFVYLYRLGALLAWRRFALVLALCSSLLVADFLVVGAWTGKSPQSMGLSLSPPGTSADAAKPSNRLLAFLLKNGSTIYLYTTASYAGFAAWFPLEHQRTYGLRAIYPIPRALQRAGLLDVRLPPAIPGFVLILSTGPVLMGWNAYSLLYDPFLDFGVAGVFFYCLVIGAAAGVAYQFARAARDSPARLLVVSQVTLALALSIFVNKFNNTASWYILLWSIAPFVATDGLARARNLIRTRAQPRG